LNKANFSLEYIPDEIPLEESKGNDFMAAEEEEF
jgi:hypothetical protein